MTVATIFTCAGLELTEAEISFFKETDPFGFILFADNIDTPAQIRALTSSLRDCVGRDDAPILIDQEGGRVARLTPPQWREAPPAKVFGDLALKDMDVAKRAAWVNARLFAAELTDLGIDVDCVAAHGARDHLEQCTADCDRAADPVKLPCMERGSGGRAQIPRRAIP